MVVFVFEQGHETFCYHVFELDLFRDHFFWLHSARADCLEDFVEISENICSDTLSSSQSKLVNDPLEISTLYVFSRKTNWLGMILASFSLTFDQ